MLKATHTTTYYHDTQTIIKNSNHINNKLYSIYFMHQKNIQQLNEPLKIAAAIQKRIKSEDI